MITLVLGRKFLGTINENDWRPEVSKMVATMSGGLTPQNSKNNDWRHKVSNGYIDLLQMTT